jgi:hypothetical protein
MLIFWKERLVFLANTKAGSTSIAAALESLAQVSVQRPAALKHTTAASYRQFIAPWIEAQAGGPFTTVALMREPIDWLGSWYRARQRDDSDGTAESTAGMGFADFSEATLSAAPPPCTHLPGQAAFLAADEGRTPLVDHIFRYEAIDRFVHFLEERLNFAITLPHLNVSPHSPVTLESQLHDRLAAHLAADYRLYDRICPDGRIA